MHFSCLHRATDLFGAGRWTELRTVAVGAVAPDLYGASMRALGDVALVLARRMSTAATAR